MKTKLILASQSPRRKRLIREMRLEFDIIPSGADEDTALVRPSAVVKTLAAKKALEVSRRYPDRPVIGADTIVVCKSRILGKPKDYKDALRLLRMENGSWQKVYTGVAVIWAARGISLCDYEVTACKARHLSDDQLKEYAGKHHDKAGAYAVQDNEDPFIEKFVGPMDNVVGLPCALLAKLLKKAGYK